MAVRPDGRRAVTHWEILERYPGVDGTAAASLLACRLMTGRTHQIRVHLASIGHPLIGDHLYGAGFRTKIARFPTDARAGLAALGRQALHAYLLAIEHPSRGEYLEFRSELPDDLICLQRSLGNSRDPGGLQKALGKTKA
jgi:23S rRNA pseudouridine1911/1915/1917 synthase